MLVYPDLVQKTNYAAVVEDIEKITKQLSIALKPLGITPWEVTENCTIGAESVSGHKTIIHTGGGLASFRVAVAKIMAEPGQIQLTMIQPLNGDSIFSEYLNKYGNSWHHIEFVETPENIQVICADFEEAGAEKILELELPDGRKLFYYDMDGVIFALAPEFQYVGIDEFGGVKNE